MLTFAVSGSLQFWDSGDPELMLGFIQGVEAKTPAMFIVKFSKWKTIVDSSPRHFLALVILSSA